MKTDLHLPLTNIGTILNRNRTTNWSPHFNAIVVDKYSNKESFTEKFLVDTGASITILRAGLSYVFDFSNPVDKVDIYFGDAKPIDFDVYNVNIKIKGIKIEILAAYKKNVFNSPYSLFGMTKGMDIFQHIVINPKKLDYKLINKY